VETTDSVVTDGKPFALQMIACDFLGLGNPKPRGQKSTNFDP
jgi:hypothetical protein